MSADPAQQHEHNSASLRHGAAASPRVSIGLAVYNGEKYLAEAIESIIAQTYRDFELIISDNASTDLTAAICCEYEAADPRIRYSRNPTNIGGSRNESLTVDLATGEYFRWAAHDDYLEPTLLERCVRVLDDDPSIVLCYTQVNQIDEHTGESRLVSRANASSEDAVCRFARIALGRDFLEETYGLMRRDSVVSIVPQGLYVASDRPFLADLSLRGRFVEVAEPLFNKRIHPGNVYIDWRTRAAWFDPNAAGRLSFPWWSQLGDLISRVARAPIPTRARARAFLVVGAWVVVRAPNLTKDVAVAGHRFLRGRMWRMTRHSATANWE
jgi:glycosyltransferase involved in cell wall biosynthesis